MFERKEEKMGFEAGAIYILGVTGIVGCILFIRRSEWIMKLISKLCVGLVLIYGINMGLSYFNLPYEVGINWISIFSSAVFGVPGVGLLYALRIFLEFF